jgi:hypothetical protein
MRNLWTLGLCSIMFGCSQPIVLPPPDELRELGLGDTRIVELRFLRLDVVNFARSLTLHDLRQLPKKTLDETWLFDLDARPLVTNALARFTFASAADASALDPAARNMFYLLNMTPENTNLEGTALAELAAVGMAVGISPSRILADLLQVKPNERIASIDLVADVVLEHIIATHPRAQTRRGLVTAQNPDGVYPVQPGFIAVSLADIATDFGSIAERFGPVEGDPSMPNATNHPGFLQSLEGLSLFENNFGMTVRLGVNALPFQGIQASNAAKASVNSIGMQINHAFDFRDPNWMTIAGLEENLELRKVVLNINESDKHLEIGKIRDPQFFGERAIASEPPWVVESVLADVGQRLAQRIPAHCTTYSPEGQVIPPFDALTMCIDATGWVDLRIDPSIVLLSPPIAGAYLSDLLLNVAQARLHDGGLTEGQANVVMSVHNVPIGAKSTDIVNRIRTNLEKDPILLRGVAEAISDTTHGDADFFYFVPRATAEDWLYFITFDDIRQDEHGNPVRPYTYRNPGFFGDPSLATKISSLVEIDGDTSHEKVRIQVGETLYFQDAEERIYRITALEKPSMRRIRLEVERIS